MCITTDIETGFGTGVVRKLCLFPSVTALGLSTSIIGKHPSDLCVPKEKLWQVSCIIIIQHVAVHVSISSGVDSKHWDNKEDRRWKIKCCSAKGYHTEECELTKVWWVDSLYEHYIQRTCRAPFD